MVQNPVERLRERLKAWTATHPTFTVTDRSTQYAFDEDSEAFAAIGVDDVTQCSSRESIPLLVVEGRRTSNTEMLLARIWLRYGAEMWFVDAEQRVVRVYTPVARHPRTAWDRFERGDLGLPRGSEVTVVRDNLSSPVLPGFMLDVPALFADAPVD